MFRLLFAALLGVLFLTAEGRAEAPDINTFARAPAVTSIALSPNGANVAIVQRSATEHQIVVYDVATKNVTVLTRLSAVRGSINWVNWKSNERLLVGIEAYHELQVAGPDVDYSVFRVIALNRDGSHLVQMFEGSMSRLAGAHASMRLLDTLPRDPAHILVTAADDYGIGVWRANVETGAVERVLDGNWLTAGYVTDGAGYPVMRQDWLDDGRGWRFSTRAAGEVHWSEFRVARGIAHANNSPDFQPLTAAPGPSQIYVMARPEQHDLLGLYVFDTRTRTLSAALQQPLSADASTPWVDPFSHELIATCEEVERQVCAARDPAVQRHLDAVQSFVGADAEVTLVDLSEDRRRWLLRADGPSAPGAYFLYDLDSAHIEPIALEYPELAEGLAPTRIERYAGRDGTALWAYVTSRPGDGPRPTIILPHGGPESRDHYGFDFFAQYLASKGYVVVQPNFRGSDGFGRVFAEAGYRQWGARMQDDVSDAARHMIDIGVADPQRICIVGASYGGYAALAGAMSTPDLYRCAVSIAGVSDLNESLRHDRSGGGRVSMNYQYWVRSMGDPARDRDMLLAASPARHAEQITIPVLLIHGEEDGRVPIRQSELMDEALRAAGREVRFVRVPESGHIWSDWTAERRALLLQETETFLHQHLQ